MGNFFKISSLLVLLAITACSEESQNLRTDCGTGFYGNEDCAIIHWPSGSPLVFFFADDFPIDQRDTVEQGIESYSSIMENDQVVYRDQLISTYSGNPGAHRGDGKNGIYWIDEDWPWEDTNPGSIAITRITVDNDRIIEADIFFKASSFASYQPQENNLVYRWLYLASVHEVGHALGRTHSNDRNSIMAPSLNTRLFTSPLDNDIPIFVKVYSIIHSVLVAFGLA